MVVKAAFLPSITKKAVMGLSGLFLCLYLVVHLAGNLMLLRGDGGILFNQYADFMEHFWGTQVVEVILFLGFFLHIADGIVLTFQNKSARPIPYAVSKPSENSSWASRNMGLTGAVVFVFLVVHLRTFFIDQRFLEKHASMYDAALLAFHNFYYTFFYVIAVSILGLHLTHGFQSAFQSLGLNHSKYTPWIQWLGFLFSILIPAGFIFIPIYLYVHQFSGS